MKAIRKTGKLSSTRGAKTVRGAITVEAAIVLPVFLCTVLTVVFLIKAVYVHEMIQHGLVDTADDLASMSYLYYRSGLMDLDSTAQAEMKSKADDFREKMENLQQIFDTLGMAINTGGFADLLSTGAYDNLKSGLFNPLTRKIMEKYLITGASQDIQPRLEALGICGGFDGLDFSGSSFFDGSNDIDLVVKYKLELPLPIKLFGDFTIVQRAVAKAWAGGDDPPVTEAVSDEQEGIWSLDNFTRGKKFREIYGANLPSSFPVIAAFVDDTAVMIKSMDITAKSYADSSAVTVTITGYFKELSKYEGQEEPWGSNKITILKHDIKRKKLILVIPQNEISAEVQQELESCRTKAAATGVTLQIEKYGLADD